MPVRKSAQSVPPACSYRVRKHEGTRGDRSGPEGTTRGSERTRGDRRGPEGTLLCRGKPRGNTCLCGTLEGKALVGILRSLDPDDSNGEPGGTFGIRGGGPGVLI